MTPAALHEVPRQLDAIVQTLDLLCPDVPVAVCALHPAPKKDWMQYQYFDDHAEAARWVAALPATVKATYTVLNPFTKTSTGPGINKSDIRRRRLLLIDCDPRRAVKKSNATEAEHAAALAQSQAIKSYLTALGWPDPLEADSGNGGHLVYAIDLPNDTASTALIDGILKHLQRFDTADVEVDQTTGDANQITKLYGTMARKGPATAERPHRLAALTLIPTKLAIVPLALLQQIGGVAPKDKPKNASPTGQGLYDLDAILAKLTKFGDPVHRQGTDGGYTEYQIKCLWDAEHSDPGSKHGTIFTWSDEGAPGFTCPHDSCTKAGRRWEAFRGHLGLRARDEDFPRYFITQLGAKDGGRLITMVGHDEVFPPSFQTFGAFGQYYCDTVINVGTEERPKWTTRAQRWLQSPRHRKYTDVQFLPPPLSVPPGVLNLWNGFAVEPDPDPHPERRCALFLAHVRQVICAGEDPDVAEFLLDVLAKKVQEPARLTEVSIAIRGGQGVGKNTVTDYYGGLFGRHAATVDKQELVTGRFNAVLSSKLVLTLDEAMWPGHKEFIGALKSLVTNTFLMVERKGIDPVREQNFVQTFVLTNGAWAWPTELGDRRALIVDVSDAQKGKTPYFDALYHEREQGGLAALLAYLQARPVTHNLRLVPHTKARDTQVALTDDDPIRSLWFEMLHRGLTWPESECWDDFISTKDLEEYYAERCRATRQKPMPTKLLLQRWHEMLPPTFQQKQRRIIDRDLVLGARRIGGWRRNAEGVELLPDPAIRRGTVIPGLDVCRKHYATHVETREIDWPLVEAEPCEM